MKSVKTFCPNLKLALIGILDRRSEKSQKQLLCFPLEYDIKSCTHTLPAATLQVCEIRTSKSKPLMPVAEPPPGTFPRHLPLGTGCREQRAAGQPCAHVSDSGGVALECCRASRRRQVRPIQRSGQVRREETKQGHRESRWRAFQPLVKHEPRPPAAQGAANSKPPKRKSMMLHASGRLTWRSCKPQQKLDISMA